MRSSPAQFVASALEKRHDAVTRVDRLNDETLLVHHKQQPAFKVGVLSAQLVTTAAVEKFIVDEEIDFICNVPKEAAWTGDAVRSVQAASKAFGGVADLFSAAGNAEPVRGYIRSEFAFIERIFDQHDAISSVERVFDRVYRLHRGRGDPVTVVLINEYDLTADHVRAAWVRFGPFTDVLVNNPNCRSTDAAADAAKQLGVNVLALKPFMGRLNSR